MNRTVAALAAIAMLAAAAPAAAENFSFTGSFSQDDNVQGFNFSVGAPSNVTLRTWSYAGGVNAAGATIAGGGFDPILALFNSSGMLINQNDDGGCALVAMGNTGQCWDTFLTASLAAGSYTVTVMQYDNFAVGPNFSNGFGRAGQGNFTAGFGCAAAQGSFRDVSGSANCGRTDAWAFDILNVEAAVTASIPESSTWAMLIAGFGAVGSLLRRRRSVAL